MARPVDGGPPAWPGRGASAPVEGRAGYIGAARELVDALLINPYDLEGTAEAMYSRLDVFAPGDGGTTVSGVENEVPKRFV